MYVSMTTGWSNPVQWIVQRLTLEGWEVQARSGTETLFSAILTGAELVDLQAEITASLNEEIVDTLLGSEKS